MYLYDNFITLILYKFLDKIKIQSLDTHIVIRYFMKIF